MNNLVFNTAASELKSSMYGYNQDTLTLQLLQLDATGHVLISGAMTLSEPVTIANATLTVEGSVTVSNPVTIANATLTVEGSVTVSNPVTIANETLTVEGAVTINNAVTIANATLTVEGTVTVSNPITIGNETLTVEGSVTVNNAVTIANATLTVEGNVTINNAVTIANESLTVLVSGQAFTSDADTLTGVTGIGTVFTATNISTLRTASMFIDNVGSATVTYSLLLSPDGTTYFEDPSYTDQTVAGGAKAVIAIDRFAQFAQLEYSLGAETATFNAYYNGQA